MDYGCLCITFLVPRSHFQYLIDVATPKLKAMCHMGVLQLVINDTVLIDEKDNVSIEDSSTIIKEVHSGDTFEVETLDRNAMSLGDGEKIKESIDSQGKYG